MPENQMLARAAAIIAEFFSSALLAHKQQPIAEFTWEKAAIDWLQQWRAAGGSEPIDAWTQTYLDKGAPPWPGE